MANKDCKDADKAIYFRINTKIFKWFNIIKQFLKTLQHLVLYIIDHAKIVS